MKRRIEEILRFREDISPFLVHLTKSYKGRSAEENLKKVIKEKKLTAGDNPISDARFYISEPEKRRQFCRAISFTETPLNEIHCLLEIKGRRIDLSPYGLVFLRTRLREKGVSPVFYINNESGDKEDVIQALCQLTEVNPESAKHILPLVSVFGKELRRDKRIDFLWEREWRYPSVKGNLRFSKDDVFIGICPHDKIEQFEELFSPVCFVDCQRNMKWYASKLVNARQRSELKESVV